MIQNLQEVAQRAFERAASQIIAWIPPLLVALAILAVAFALARLVRWAISRVFKGVQLDRFLTESGVWSVFALEQRLSVAPIVAGSAYYLVLLMGVLAAINVLDTKLTAQIVEGTVLLFPKMITAAAILLLGVWLGQFLGRGALVWAVNEEIPRPRRVAAFVRTAVVFVSVVVASEAMGFAPHVFFAAFVIVGGGIVLAASLAFGLGARVAVQRWLWSDSADRDERESSLYHHL